MAFIVPLTAIPNTNQLFTVTIQINGGVVTLSLRLCYNAVAGFWTMDIADALGNPLVSSVPLLTGQWPAANILAPYGYLGIGDAFVLDLSGTGGWPDNANLGSQYLLLWDSNSN
jgi:hypothetical protein